MNLSRIAALGCLAACCGLAACNAGKEKNSYAVNVAGNPEQGKQIIQGYGCGACHIIPGIPDAHGLVGPPLMYFAQRTMIAGELPNTPENLVRWLRNPQSVEPHTAMPNVGLSESQAWDVTAYLYTLRGMKGEPWNQ
ncbi:MAG: c-type cytochrome [Acidobacteriota bacterium]